MSMSTYVKGFRPPDDKWRNMKNVYDNCVSLGINVPHEVIRFFNYDPPNENGVEVPVHMTKSNGSSVDYFDVNVSDIPKDVTILRFCNSY